MNYNFNYDFKSINFLNISPRHIVVFTGGEAPLPSVAADFFCNDDFNFKPDFVIAADSGLDTLCLYDEFFKNEFYKNEFCKNEIHQTENSKIENLQNKFDFSPNVILGDMDSLKNDLLIKKYLKNKNCQIEKFNPYKDFSDTELALILANQISKKSPSAKTKITLIGGCGGRVDHFLSILDLYNFPIRPDFWLTTNQVLTLLKSNQTAKIFPKVESSPISFFRQDFYKLNEFSNANDSDFNNFSKSKDVIKTKGLEWESDLFRDTFSASLSNVIKHDFFVTKTPINVFTKEEILIATDFSTKVSVE